MALTILAHRPSNLEVTHKTLGQKSRWSDMKTSLTALMGVAAAIVMPTAAVACEKPQEGKPVLELKSDPSPQGNIGSNDKDKATEKDKDKGKDKGDKINLGPLPSIPIPKIPPIPPINLSIDDLMDKVHNLAEQIGEEIKGRVPTLADYFMAVDTIRKELQLGDGSLYQSIVANMSDTNKNPEIQLDATVRKGNSLCPQELAFRIARRKKMKKAFAKFIGVKESEVNEADIPVVAIAGSKNRVLTLVDAFGTVLGSRLLIHREHDSDFGENGEWVDPLDFKLSQQSRWTNYGDQPLPIYTAVSHILPNTGPEPKVVGDIVVDNDVGKEEDDSHYYQWFEMTPYEFGSEETSAWIPTWSFGRRFVEGKSVEKVPETNLAILLGTFGSAFTATLADYYNEVRPLLNKAMSDSMDTYIKDLPNPEPEAEHFSHRKNLYLNDAGMDNNLPLYPLLRPGRDVDVILAFDSSADIESVPWFEKTDEYVKRRGIERWPPISKTRAEQLEKQEGGPPRKMTHVELFHGIVADDRDADHIAQPEQSGAPRKTVLSQSKQDVQPITLVYFPLIPNQEYKEFNPSSEAFCSTFNFEVKEEQVELLAGLAEKNFGKAVEDVRKVLKETWIRKKKARQEHEKQERKNKPKHSETNNAKK
ncbi:hypothetical protein BGZ52_008930 [Haplosporangium bisporale]|nr:hypothetical protein BGZ52_008930 [Haplosporangium bisporale]